LHYKHHIRDIDLHRLPFIKDLGILFDSKLLLNNHVSAIKNKALDVLGMIKRNCTDFHDPLAVKCLYSIYLTNPFLIGIRSINLGQKQCRTQ